MSGALVLNATYEPLCVVPSRRAAVLVIAQRAEILHDTGQALHSEHLVVPVPSVIRLRTFVKVPYRRRAPLNRRGIFARDGHRCQYCGDSAESIDHVVPRSKGGEHAWENVVAACRSCNVRKGDRLLHNTAMELRRRPAAPRELTWVIVAVGSVPEHWEPYLRPATPVRVVPSWEVVRHRESAREFHAREVPAASERCGCASRLARRWCSAARNGRRSSTATPLLVVVWRSCGAAAGEGQCSSCPAICSGSTSPSRRDDAAVAGRRRSGVPLARRGLAGSAGGARRDDDGPSRRLGRSPWSDVVCFAGLGPGEVRNQAGAKVVGMSQRRTREAARFQCAALARWDPKALVDLLAGDLDGAELTEVAAGVGVDLEELLGAFLRHLP